MFVKRLIRLAVVDDDDAVEDAFDSFLLIPFDWLLLLSILHGGDAEWPALLDLRPKNASTC